MADDKKSKKSSTPKDEPVASSLDAPKKKMAGFPKREGQPGIHDPNDIDGIRRAKPEERHDSGKRIFGGVSEPRVSDQTYDCYDPPKKKKTTKKNEE